MSETMHEITLRIDKAIEAKDTVTILSYFNENCEIFLSGQKIKGKTEAKKWTEWLYSYFAELRIIPENGFVGGSLFFRKFTLKAILHDGSEILSKQAGVLEFSDQKIKSLRLDFDRADFDRLDLAYALTKAPGGKKELKVAIEK
ncbi:hypothetical protein MSMTP_1706 [Methanosarcina sp. MTP4]|uniref:nuclear transport factor 2 family protein n=1 Tax=Methanosarcina sp. MTP4 TaxID=1434100 RepID=UPI00061554C8|nr:nuclear transport factor 2 family protein [Methanosarcina sp. MTP4]AKB25175.1 hypothetical protein MSMTP_1706 [Methanosarcina sp. MTP4]